MTAGATGDWLRRVPKVELHLHLEGAIPHATLWELHATRAEEDPALVDYLAEHRIPLELCPISNLRTNVVPSIDAHPVRRYFERGLLVTINTDDPEMFGNSLAQEFQALVEVHGFTRDEIRTLILNAVMASWLPADRRRQLAEDLQDDPDWR